MPQLCHNTAAIGSLPGDPAEKTCDVHSIIPRLSRGLLLYFKQMWVRELQTGDLPKL